MHTRPGKQVEAPEDNQGTPIKISFADQAASTRDRVPFYVDYANPEGKTLITLTTLPTLITLITLVFGQTGISPMDITHIIFILIITL